MATDTDKPTAPKEETKPKSFKRDGIQFTPDGLTRGDTIRCTYKDKQGNPRRVWLQKPLPTI